MKSEFDELLRELGEVQERKAASEGMTKAQRHGDFGAPLPPPPTRRSARPDPRDARRLERLDAELRAKTRDLAEFSKSLRTPAEVRAEAAAERRRVEARFRDTMAKAESMHSAGRITDAQRERLVAHASVVADRIALHDRRDTLLKAYENPGRDGRPAFIETEFSRQFQNIEQRLAAVARRAELLK